ncbi:mucin-17 [Eurosta solidaginis]|uniref:mucin-17 n=1 Tax=Eurosta solidaginis TaxID=178769 RepID=UPI0035316E44
MSTKAGLLVTALPAIAVAHNHSPQTTPRSNFAKISSPFKANCDYTNTQGTYNTELSCRISRSSSQQNLETDSGKGSCSPALLDCSFDSGIVIGANGTLKEGGVVECSVMEKVIGAKTLTETIERDRMSETLPVTSSVAPGVGAGCVIGTGMSCNAEEQMRQKLRYERLQQWRLILLELDRQRDPYRRLRERLSKICERRIFKKGSANENICNVCCRQIVQFDSKSVVTCCVCNKQICRGAKCSTWLPKAACWECQLCHTSKDSLSHTQSWVAEQMSFNRQKYVYPMRARSEIYIPIRDCNESPMHFESVSQVGENTAAITAEQKLKIREYVEEVVANLLGGSLDQIRVGQLSKSENYLPGILNNSEPPQPAIATTNGNQCNNSKNVKKAAEFSEISQTRLRYLIESIIAETLGMPPLANGSASEVALNVHARSNGAIDKLALHNGNLRLRHRHRSDHYFEPKIYQDLLATAVLNKIADREGNLRQLSESTPDLSSRTIDANFNAENQSTSSGSSVEPRSDFSYTDIEQSPKITKTLVGGRESALSDYIAGHTVPLPDLSAAVTESEEDDHISMSSSTLAEGTWEDNWLFKKKRSSLTTSMTGSVGMLVPAPKDDVRAQIGDKTTDEISDLSEMGSDTDDSSIKTYGGNLDQLNDRILSKHLIGGQNTKVVLDELIESTSLVSNTTNASNAPEFLETRNEHVVVGATLNTEAVNSSVFNHTVKEAEVKPSPISARNQADDDIIEEIACTGYNIDDMFDDLPTERKTTNTTCHGPSVIEILAAMALGPMLAVPTSEQSSILTSTASLKELSDIALAEIKTCGPAIGHCSLDIIDEEEETNILNATEYDGSDNYFASMVSPAKQISSSDRMQSTYLLENAIGADQDNDPKKEIEETEQQEIERTESVAENETREIRTTAIKETILEMKGATEATVAAESMESSELARTEQTIESLVAEKLTEASNDLDSELKTPNAIQKFAPAHSQPTTLLTSEIESLSTDGIQWQKEILINETQSEANNEVVTKIENNPEAKVVVIPSQTPAMGVYKDTLNQISDQILPTYLDEKALDISHSSSVENTTSETDSYVKLDLPQHAENELYLVEIEAPIEIISNEVPIKLEAEKGVDASSEVSIETYFGESQSENDSVRLQLRVIELERAVRTEILDEIVSAEPSVNIEAHHLQTVERQEISQEKLALGEPLAQLFVVETQNEMEYGTLQPNVIVLERIVETVVPAEMESKETFAHVESPPLQAIEIQEISQHKVITQEQANGEPQLSALKFTEETAEANAAEAADSGALMKSYSLNLPLEMNEKPRDIQSLEEELKVPTLLALTPAQRSTISEEMPSPTDLSKQQNAKDNNVATDAQASTNELATTTQIEKKMDPPNSFGREIRVLVESADKPTVKGISLEGDLQLPRNLEEEAEAINITEYVDAKDSGVTVSELPQALKKPAFSETELAQTTNVVPAGKSSKEGQLAAPPNEPSTEAKDAKTLSKSVEEKQSIATMANMKGCAQTELQISEVIATEGTQEALEKYPLKKYNNEVELPTPQTIKEAQALVSAAPIESEASEIAGPSQAVEETAETTPQIVQTKIDEKGIAVKPQALESTLSTEALEQTFTDLPQNRNSAMYVDTVSTEVQLEDKTSCDRTERSTDFKTQMPVETPTPKFETEGNSFTEQLANKEPALKNDIYTPTENIAKEAFSPAESNISKAAVDAKELDLNPQVSKECCPIKEEASPKNAEDQIQTKPDTFKTTEIELTIIDTIQAPAAEEVSAQGEAHISMASVNDSKSQTPAKESLTELQNQYELTSIPRSPVDSEFMKSLGPAIRAKLDKYTNVTELGNEIAKDEPQILQSTLSPEKPENAMRNDAETSKPKSITKSLKEFNAATPMSLEISPQLPQITAVVAANIEIATPTAEPNTRTTEVFVVGTSISTETAVGEVISQEVIGTQDIDPMSKSAAHITQPSIEESSNIIKTQALFEAARCAIPIRSKLHTSHPVEYEFAPVSERSETKQKVDEALPPSNDFKDEQNTSLFVGQERVAVEARGSTEELIRKAFVDIEVSKYFAKEELIVETERELHSCRPQLENIVETLVLSSIKMNEAPEEIKPADAENPSDAENPIEDGTEFVEEQDEIKLKATQLAESEPPITEKASPKTLSQSPLPAAVGKMEDTLIQISAEAPIAKIENALLPGILDLKSTGSEQAAPNKANSEDALPNKTKYTATSKKAGPSSVGLLIGQKENADITQNLAETRSTVAENEQEPTRTFILSLTLASQSFSKETETQGEKISEETSSKVEPRIKDSEGKEVVDFSNSTSTSTYLDISAPKTEEATLRETQAPFVEVVNEVTTHARQQKLKTTEERIVTTNITQKASVTTNIEHDTDIVKLSSKVSSDSQPKILGIENEKTDKTQILMKGGKKDLADTLNLDTDPQVIPNQANVDSQDLIQARIGEDTSAIVSNLAQATLNQSKSEVIIKNPTCKVPDRIDPQVAQTVKNVKMVDDQLQTQTERSIDAFHKEIVVESGVLCAVVIEETDPQISTQNPHAAAELKVGDIAIQASAGAPGGDEAFEERSESKIKLLQPTKAENLVSAEAKVPTGDTLQESAQNSLTAEHAKVDDTTIDTSDGKPINDTQFELSANTAELLDTENATVIENRVSLTAPPKETSQEISPKLIQITEVPKESDLHYTSEPSLGHKSKENENNEDSNEAIPVLPQSSSSERPTAIEEKVTEATEVTNSHILHPNENVDETQTKTLIEEIFVQAESTMRKSAVNRDPQNKYEHTMNVEIDATKPQSEVESSTRNPIETDLETEVESVVLFQELARETTTLTPTQSLQTEVVGKVIESVLETPELPLPKAPQDQIANETASSTDKPAHHSTKVVNEENPNISKLTETEVSKRTEDVEEGPKKSSSLSETEEPTNKTSQETITQPEPKEIQTLNYGEVVRNTSENLADEGFIRTVVETKDTLEEGFMDLASITSLQGAEKKKEEPNISELSKHRKSNMIEKEALTEIPNNDLQCKAKQDKLQPIRPDFATVQQEESSESPLPDRTQMPMLYENETEERNEKIVYRIHTELITENTTKDEAAKIASQTATESERPHNSEKEARPDVQAFVSRIDKKTHAKTETETFQSTEVERKLDLSTQKIPEASTTRWPNKIPEEALRSDEIIVEAQYLSQGKPHKERQVLTEAVPEHTETQQDAESHMTNGAKVKIVLAVMKEAEPPYEATAVQLRNSAINEESIGENLDQDRKEQLVQTNPAMKEVTLQKAPTKQIEKIMDDQPQTPTERLIDQTQIEVKSDNLQCAETGQDILVDTSVISVKVIEEAPPQILSQDPHVEASYREDLKDAFPIVEQDEDISKRYKPQNVEISQEIKADTKEPSNLGKAPLTEIQVETMENPFQNVATDICISETQTHAKLHLKQTPTAVETLVLSQSPEEDAKPDVQLDTPQTEDLGASQIQITIEAISENHPTPSETITSENVYSSETENEAEPQITQTPMTVEPQEFSQSPEGDTKPHVQPDMLPTEDLVPSGRQTTNKALSAEPVTPSETLTSKDVCSSETENEAEPQIPQAPIAVKTQELPRSPGEDAKPNVQPDTPQTVDLVPSEIQITNESISAEGDVKPRFQPDTLQTEDLVPSDTPSEILTSKDVCSSEAENEADPQITQAPMAVETQELYQSPEGAAKPHVQPDTLQTEALVPSKIQLTNEAISADLPTPFETLTSKDVCSSETQNEAEPQITQASMAVETHELSQSPVKDAKPNAKDLIPKEIQITQKEISADLSTPSETLMSKDACSSETQHEAEPPIPQVPMAVETQELSQSPVKDAKHDAKSLIPKEIQITKEEIPADLPKPHVQPDTPQTEDIVPSEIQITNEAISVDFLTPSETRTSKDVCSSKTENDAELQITQTPMAVETQELSQSSEGDAKPHVQPDTPQTEDIVPSEIQITNEAISADFPTPSETLKSKDVCSSEIENEAELQITQTPMAVATQKLSQSPEGDAKPHVQPDTPQTEDIVPSEIQIAKEAISADLPTPSETLTSKYVCSSETKNEAEPQKTQTPTAVETQELYQSPEGDAKPHVQPDILQTEDLVQSEIQTTNKALSAEPVTSSETLTSKNECSSETENEVVPQITQTPMAVETQELYQSPEGDAKLHVQPDPLQTEALVQSETQITNEAISADLPTPSESVTSKDVCSSETENEAEPPIPQESMAVETQELSQSPGVNAKRHVQPDTLQTKALGPSEIQITNEAISADLPTPSETLTSKDVCISETQNEAELQIPQTPMAVEAHELSQSPVKDAKHDAKNLIPKEIQITKEEIPVDLPTPSETLTSKDACSFETQHEAELQIPQALIAVETQELSQSPGVNAKRHVQPDTPQTEALVPSEIQITNEAISADFPTSSETRTSKDVCSSETENEAELQITQTPMAVETQELSQSAEGGTKPHVQPYTPQTEALVPSEIQVTNEAISADYPTPSETLKLKDLCSSEIENEAELQITQTPMAVATQELSQSPEGGTKPHDQPDTPQTEALVPSEIQITNEAISADFPTSSETRTSKDVCSSETENEAELQITQTPMAVETQELSQSAEGGTKPHVQPYTPQTEALVPSEIQVTNEAISADFPTPSETLTSKDVCTSETENEAELQITQKPMAVALQELSQSPEGDAKPHVQPDTLQTEALVPSETQITKETISADLPTPSETLTSKDVCTSETENEAELQITQKPMAVAKQEFSQSAEGGSKPHVQPDTPQTEALVPSEIQVTNEAISADFPTPSETLTSKDVCTSETENEAELQITQKPMAVALQELSQSPEGDAKPHVQPDTLQTEALVPSETQITKETISADLPTPSESVTSKDVCSSETENEAEPQIPQESMAVETQELSQSPGVNAKRHVQPDTLQTKALGPSEIQITNEAISADLPTPSETLTSKDVCISETQNEAEPQIPQTPTAVETHELAQSPVKDAKPDAKDLIPKEIQITKEEIPADLPTPSETFTSNDACSSETQHEAESHIPQVPMAVETQELSQSPGVNAKPHVQPYTVQSETLVPSEVHIANEAISAEPPTPSETLTSKDVCSSGTENEAEPQITQTPMGVETQDLYQSPVKDAKPDAKDLIPKEIQITQKEISADLPTPSEILTSKHVCSSGTENEAEPQITQTPMAVETQELYQYPEGDAKPHVQPYTVQSEALVPSEVHIANEAISADLPTPSETLTSKDVCSSETENEAEPQIPQASMAVETQELSQSPGVNAKPHVQPDTLQTKVLGPSEIQITNEAISADLPTPYKPLTSKDVCISETQNEAEPQIPQTPTAVETHELSQSPVKDAKPNAKDLIPKEIQITQKEISADLPTPSETLMSKDACSSETQHEAEPLIPQVPMAVETQELSQSPVKDAKHDAKSLIPKEIQITKEEIPADLPKPHVQPDTPQTEDIVPSEIQITNEAISVDFLTPSETRTSKDVCSSETENEAELQITQTPMTVETQELSQSSEGDAKPHVQPDTPQTEDIVPSEIQITNEAISADFPTPSETLKSKDVCNSEIENEAELQITQTPMAVATQELSQSPEGGTKLHVQPDTPQTEALVPSEIQVTNEAISADFPTPSETLTSKDVCTSETENEAELQITQKPMAVATQEFSQSAEGGTKPHVQPDTPQTEALVPSEIQVTNEAISADFSTPSETLTSKDVCTSETENEVELKITQKPMAVATQELSQSPEGDAKPHVQPDTLQTEALVPSETQITKETLSADFPTPSESVTSKDVCSSETENEAEPQIPQESMAVETQELSQSPGVNAKRHVQPDTLQTKALGPSEIQITNEAISADLPTPSETLTSKDVCISETQNEAQPQIPQTPMAVEAHELSQSPVKDAKYDAKNLIPKEIQITKEEIPADLPTPSETLTSKDACSFETQHEAELQIPQAPIAVGTQELSQYPGVNAKPHVQPDTPQTEALVPSEIQVTNEAISADLSTPSETLTSKDVCSCESQNEAERQIPQAAIAVKPQELPQSPGVDVKPNVQPDTLQTVDLVPSEIQMTNEAISAYLPIPSETLRSKDVWISETQNEVEPQIPQAPMAIETQELSQSSGVNVRPVVQPDMPQTEDLIPSETQITIPALEIEAFMGTETVMSKYVCLAEEGELKITTTEVETQELSQAVAVDANDVQTDFPKTEDLVLRETQIAFEAIATDAPRRSETLASKDVCTTETQSQTQPYTTASAESQVEPSQAALESTNMKGEFVEASAINGVQNTFLLPEKVPEVSPLMAKLEADEIGEGDMTQTLTSESVEPVTVDKLFPVLEEIQSSSVKIALPDERDRTEDCDVENLGDFENQISNANEIVKTAEVTTDKSLDKIEAENIPTTETTDETFSYEKDSSVSNNTLDSSGSIAEREHKKWNNAVDMPNNPYAPEALKRRISGSPERFIDLPNINLSMENQVISLMETTKTETNSVDEIEYARYSRDYYINDDKTSKTSPKHQSNTKDCIRSSVSASTDGTTDIAINEVNSNGKNPNENIPLNNERSDCHWTISTPVCRSSSLKLINRRSPPKSYYNYNTNSNSLITKLKDELPSRPLTSISHYNNSNYLYDIDTPKYANHQRPASLYGNIGSFDMYSYTVDKDDCNDYDVRSQLSWRSASAAANYPATLPKRRALSSLSFHSSASGASSLNSSVPKKRTLPNANILSQFEKQLLHKDLKRNSFRAISATTKDFVMNPLYERENVNFSDVGDTGTIRPNLSAKRISDEQIDSGVDSCPNGFSEADVKTSNTSLLF